MFNPKTGLSGSVPVEEVAEAKKEGLMLSEPSQGWNRVKNFGKEVAKGFVGGTMDMVDLPWNLYNLTRKEPVKTPTKALGLRSALEKLIPIDPNYAHSEKNIVERYVPTIAEWMGPGGLYGGAFKMGRAALQGGAQATKKAAKKAFLHDNFSKTATSSSIGGGLAEQLTHDLGKEDSVVESLLGTLLGGKAGRGMAARQTAKKAKKMEVPVRAFDLYRGKQDYPTFQDLDVDRIKAFKARDLPYSVGDVTNNKKNVVKERAFEKTLPFQEFRERQSDAFKKALEEETVKVANEVSNNYKKQFNREFEPLQALRENVMEPVVTLDSVQDFFNNLKKKYHQTPQTKAQMTNDNALMAVINKDPLMREGMVGGKPKSTLQETKNLRSFLKKRLKDQNLFLQGEDHSLVSKLRQDLTKDEINAFSGLGQDKEKVADLYERYGHYKHQIEPTLEKINNNLLKGEKTAFETLEAARKKGLPIAEEMIVSSPLLQANKAKNKSDLLKAEAQPHYFWESPQALKESLINRIPNWLRTAAYKKATRNDFLNQPMIDFNALTPSLRRAYENATAVNWIKNMERGLSQRPAIEVTFPLVEGEQ